MTHTKRREQSDRSINPVQQRVEAVSSLWRPPTTFFLCEQVLQGEDRLVLLTEPSGVVHARVNGQACTDTPHDLRDLRIKNLDIHPQSPLLTELYRLYGASKCHTVNDLEKLQKPFSSTENFFQNVKFLPIAMLYGQWEHVG